MIIPPTYTNKIITNNGYITATGNIHPKYQRGVPPPSIEIDFIKTMPGYEATIGNKTLAFNETPMLFYHLQWWAENVNTPLYITLAKYKTGKPVYCTKWTS